MFTLLFRLLFIAVISFVAYEAYLGYGYVKDLTGAAQGLERVSDRVAGSSLIGDEANLLGLRSELLVASEKLTSTQERMHGDPGLKLASMIPSANQQIDAFDILVDSTNLLAVGGIQATDILQTYLDRSADGLSAVEAIELKGEIRRVQGKLAEAKDRRAQLGDDLIAPLAQATAELDRTISLVESLLGEYERLLS